LLQQGQLLVVPEPVKKMLNLGNIPLLKPVVWGYKISRKMKLDGLLKAIILPPAYKAEIQDLDRAPV
jgi:hypothetical protein